jgi:hypothetical protein
MTKNYIQATLGGQKMGLKFNLGTLKHIGDITGADPLGFSVRSEFFVQDLTVIVYAGLLSNAQSKKEEPGFTKEDVEGWVSEIENMGEAVAIVTAFTNAYKVEVSGEETADTRGQKAADVSRAGAGRVRRM